MKVNFKLFGVDCAVCASKLESAINKLSFIKSASLSFVDLKLFVETTNDCTFSEQELEDKLQEVTSKILPAVIIKGSNKQSYLEKLKSKSKNKEFAKSEITINTANHIHISDEEVNDVVNTQNLSKLPKLSTFSAIETENANIQTTNYKINFLSYNFIRVYCSAILFLLGILLPVGFWWKFAIYLVSYLLVGYDVIYSAIKNIVKGKFLDEKFLMSLASIAAFIIKEMPEAVAVMLLYQVGELFQNHAINKSRSAIGSIVSIKPEYANLVCDNEIVKVEPEQLNVNDIILIKAGEKVPTDVKIIKGDTNFNTSAVTGESMPLFATNNTVIYSGSINITNPVYAVVLNDYSNSTVAKILDLLENNSQKKSKAENFITKFAKYYTPIVVFLAVLMFSLFPLYGGGIIEGVHKASVFLVISCPCALVISIPLTYYCGLGVSAKNGLLIKGANVLDNINKLKAICFDKTGTVTKGEFKITEVFAVKNQNEMLKYLVYAESVSNHPIAKCIVNDNKINQKLITSAQEVMGQGIIATIEDNNIVCGNATLLKNNNIDFNEQMVAGTIIYIAKNNEYLGYVVVSDVIKETAKSSITEISSYNIKTVMLTGDNRVTAEYVAYEVGLSDYKYELLPQNKVKELENIEKQYGFVGFVGDGINDAPVLKNSLVGYSMGINGSDTAIEASDVVLINDDLSAVASSIKIAKQTRKISIQNIVFCLLVKLAIMVLGVLNLAPMYLAIFADVGVSVIAILNAIRIFFIKFKTNK